MIYKPDKWLIIKYPYEGETVFRVFATWHGGYLNGDSWKLNSGITKTKYKDGLFSFHGESGSVYTCHENKYGSTGYGNTVLGNLIEKFKDLSVDVTILSKEDVNDLYKT